MLIMGRLCVWGQGHTRNLRSISASLVAQSVKNLPAMQETQLQFLGQEDTLEKEMETQSSILPWRIPWTEEPGYQFCFTSKTAPKK